MQISVNRGCDKKNKIRKGKKQGIQYGVRKVIIIQKRNGQKNIKIKGTN